MWAHEQSFPVDQCQLLDYYIFFSNFELNYLSLVENLSEMFPNKSKLFLLIFPFMYGKHKHIRPASAKVKLDLEK